MIARKYFLFALIFSITCLSFFGFTNSTSAEYPPWDQVGCNVGTQFNPYSGKPCLGFSEDVSTGTSLPLLYNFGTVTLRNGSRGEAVKELQRFLNARLNLGLVIDGKLGPKTILVIKTWQRDHSLVADGLVGPKTKAMMNAEASNAQNLNNQANSNVENTVQVTPDGTAKRSGGTVTAQLLTILDISGPQSLKVNEKGTWLLKISDKSGKKLSYTVDWGDKVFVLDNGPAAGVPSQQSATFTHIYPAVGTYTPKFTVSVVETGLSTQTVVGVNVVK